MGGLKKTDFLFVVKSELRVEVDGVTRLGDRLSVDSDLGVFHRVQGER